MKAIRDWKQHFDPDMDFVFLRRMTVGGVKVVPGDAMSEDLKARVSAIEARLRAAKCNYKD